MHHGTYLWKYHSKQRWYKWYRYQKYYLLFIWTNTMMSIAFLIDFFFVLRGSYHRVVKMMPVSNRRKALHYIGRLITFTTIYIWPFFNPNLTWTKAFIWSTIPYGIIGYCFALCAQLNHVNAENQDQFNKDWYKHQVITSHTFAPQSLFWFFFSGGLNLQIEHHLFPGVNHWHLRKIQPLVRAVCEKHGVFYNCSETGWEAIMKHLKHIDRMSKTGKQTERAFVAQSKTS
jgi:fatty acid desaturase